MSKLELIAPLDAATEKKLSRHKANIILFEKGVQRSGAEFFGYIFLLGRELNLIAEALPGQFNEWMEQNAPGVAKSKIFRYREFAKLIEPKILAALGSKSSLQAPTVGVWGKKIPAKALPTIVDAVRESMDGKGMMMFMREEKLLNAPKSAGGFRPEAEALEAWLQANHPKLAAKSFDELPDDVQKAFKEQYEPPKATPEQMAELNREACRDAAKLAAEVLDEQLFADLDDPSEMDKLATVFADLAKAMKTAVGKLGKK